LPSLVRSSEVSTVQGLVGSSSFDCTSSRHGDLRPRAVRPKPATGTRRRARQLRQKLPGTDRSHGTTIKSGRVLGPAAYGLPQDRRTARGPESALQARSSHSERSRVVHRRSAPGSRAPQIGNQGGGKKWVAFFKIKAPAILCHIRRSSNDT
jgi:hypothetical protein